jgi:hypothetical protein
LYEGLPVKRLGLLLLYANFAAAAQPMRIAVLPLHDLGLGSEAVGELEHALVEAIAAQPGFSVANLNANGRLTGPKNYGGEAAARAQQLGKEVNAARALVVDVARLGDGQVVYLQGIDPRTGQIVGSTTASLSDVRPLPAAELNALRGAVVRVVAPDDYVGHLLLKLDVKGAEAQLDGAPLLADLSRPVTVPVGTHALRVTHPAYHDFLRFIDVGFDQTVDLPVPLAAYPLTEGEMAERRRRGGGDVKAKAVPWYRSWWALTLSGVVITGVVAGIVVGARPDPIGADRSLSYRYVPTP